MIPIYFFHFTSFHTFKRTCWKVTTGLLNPDYKLRACSHSAIFSDCDCNFIFAYNGLHRSWWCYCSYIVWTLPLIPVQPIRGIAVAIRKKRTVWTDLKSSYYSDCTFICVFSFKKRAASKREQESIDQYTFKIETYNWVFPNWIRGNLQNL